MKIAKAPDNILIGDSRVWRRSRLKLEEGNVIHLQFGKGERDRSLRYLIKKVEKDEKDDICFIHLERTHTYSY